jgi:hypothetical protein
MPYPTTPLYYAGATGWTLTGVTALSSTSQTPSSGTAALIASELQVIQSNVLTGCLTGEGSAFSSGVYTVTFSVAGGPSTLTMPLRVVGQDTQDNSVPLAAANGYSINSGGVGTLPPSGYQQGVVNVGQTYIGPLFLSYGADNPNFGGNFLFGFSGLGVDPAGCGNGAALSDGVYLSAAPSIPGRYDVLFDGTTQSCSSPPPVMQFPTSPAPLVFASADVLSPSVVIGSLNVNGLIAGGTVSGVTLSDPNAGASTVSAAGNVLEFEAGGSAATIPVAVSLTYSISDTYCPGCIDQIEVGLNTDTGPQVCAYNGGDGPSGASGTATVVVNVPNAPGRYYIAVDRGQDFGCNDTTHNWWNGQPVASRFTGIVDVWPTAE